MTRGFLIFFVAIALVILATVDFDALGGESFLGWLCHDSLSFCRSMSRFLG